MLITVVSYLYSNNNIVFVSSCVININYLFEPKRAIDPQIVWNVLYNHLWAFVAFSKLCTKQAEYMYWFLQLMDFLTLCDRPVVKQLTLLLYFSLCGLLACSGWWYSGHYRHLYSDVYWRSGASGCAHFMLEFLSHACFYDLFHGNYVTRKECNFQAAIIRWCGIEETTTLLNEPYMSG